MIHDSSVWKLCPLSLCFYILYKYNKIQNILLIFLSFLMPVYTSIMSSVLHLFSQIKSPIVFSQADIQVPFPCWQPSFAPFPTLLYPFSNAFYFIFQMWKLVRLAKKASSFTFNPFHNNAEHEMCLFYSYHAPRWRLHWATDSDVHPQSQYPFPVLVTENSDLVHMP